MDRKINQLLEAEGKIDPENGSLLGENSWEKLPVYNVSSSQNPKLGFCSGIGKQI